MVVMTAPWKPKFKNFCAPTVGDAEDVVLASIGGDVKSSNSTDGEETGNDGQLTTNHETGEVAPVVSEDKLGIGLTEPVGSTLFHWKLGNDEKANLDSLKTSHDEHEEEE